jgi:hypothetical protein
VRSAGCKDALAVSHSNLWFLSRGQRSDVHTKRATDSLQQFMLLMQLLALVL